MENYKGIYYNDSKEQKFFEGGAHFKYESLFKILLSLGGKIKEEDHSNNPGLLQNYGKEQIQIDKDIKYLLKKVDGKKSKYKTRNLAQFSYVNNPNTKIKFNTRNIDQKAHLSIKNENHFHSRNAKANQLFERNNESYINKTTTSLTNNNIKNNINSNLINYLLYKKQMAMKNEEKNNDNIINNDNKDNNNKHSITHCYKYIHNRNKSDAFINFNNNILSNINNARSTKNIGSEKKSNINNYHKKIMINKSSKFNNIIKNDNYVNNSYYNKIPLETNEQKINENDKNEIGEISNINISRNNCPILYDKSMISNLKDKIKSDLSYDKIVKRSRNIINKRIMSYNTCGINNNINNNYLKRYINNYIPREENKNKINNNLINYSYNLNNINNNLSKSINNNNTLYSYENYGNNIPKTINIKNKQKIIKSTGNNIKIQKYIKKKINQLYVFNQNNYKNKGGKINSSNNMNKLSNINGKYIIQ